MEIRASTLNSFHKCPRKHKEVPFDGKLEDTYFGTIIHLAARGEDVTAHINYYKENICSDFKQIEILKHLCSIVWAWVADRSLVNFVLTNLECDMIFKFGEDDTIKGEPDRVEVYDDYVHIFDFKSCKAGTEKQYLDGTVFDENAQHWIYGFLCMLYYKKKKARFQYIPLQKKLGAKVQESAVFEMTFEDAKKRAIDVATDYKFSFDMNMFQEKFNSGCYFCPLSGGCSMYGMYLKEKRKDDIQ